MSRAPLRVAILAALLSIIPLAGALDAPAVPELPALATGGDAREASGDASFAADAYAVGFRCPEQVESDLTQSNAVCPLYVLDREDVFGQPVLVIDPNNPDVIGFGAMHGGRGVHVTPDNQPPSERSRHDPVHQPHTTFRSTDGGRAWEDMPYHAPDSLQRRDQAGQPTRDIYGEDNAATLDAQGRLYLAALYAFRESATSLTDATGPEFRWSAGVWKAKTLAQPVDYNVNLKIIESGNGGANAVQDMHLVHVPGTNVVALAWLETTPEGLVGAEGNASEVVIHWTRPDDGALWTREAVGIGDCRSITNPIAVGHLLYVGCMPPLGANEEATAPLAIHEIDTNTWTSRKTGEAPITDGRALLVPRGPYGLMVALASGLDADRRPFVQLSYGELGGRWSGVEDFGADLTQAAQAPLVEARVTAAAYAPQTGHLHLIYMERYDLASVNQDTAGTPEFWKTFASIRAEGTFQTRLDLGVGTASRIDFSPTLTGVGSGAFNDLHDSITIWRGPDGIDREFVAFGDYGYVRFAEVTEENYPPVGLPIPASVPPVPVASAGAAPLMLGIPAGVLAGAMVWRTLAARRQTAVEVGAE